MIDYVSLELLGFDKIELLNNPLLNFMQKVNTETGEICTTDKNGKPVQPFKEAYYKSLRFIIYPNIILIRGSLHYYFNNGKHNYNDFGCIELLTVLEDFKTKFNIQPHQLKLRCVEAGVNIVCDLAEFYGLTLHQLMNNCFLHKTKSFEIIRNFNGKGTFIQFEHSLYLIKLYDKGKQFELSNNVFRIEVKFMKMQDLKKIGIYTLQDILNNGLMNFENDLLNAWENILFYDPTIQIDPLTKEVLPNYSNPNYWNDLLMNPNNFKYHRKQYRILQKNSVNIQLKISNMIKTKIQELTLV